MWHGKPFETVRFIGHKGATTMGSMSDKTAGLANQAAGTIKQKIGETVGNERRSGRRARPRKPRGMCRRRSVI